MKEGWAVMQAENEQLRRQVAVLQGSGGMGPGLAGMGLPNGAGRASRGAMLGMDAGLGRRPGTVAGNRCGAGAACIDPCTQFRYLPSAFRNPPAAHPPAGQARCSSRSPTPRRCPLCGWALAAAAAALHTTPLPTSPCRCARCTPAAAPAAPACAT